MLPGNLVSIYKEYKEDTNAVASWLASTARSCGYPSDLLCGGSAQATGPERSKRLKGKARKEAKAAALQSQGSSSSSSSPDYTIAIKDFVPLAEFVAASKKPVVSVPRAFANTLNRVIATRSRFSSRLAELGNSTDVSADSKHSYFVGVLEKVREVLKPRFPSVIQEASPRPPSDPVVEVGGRFADLSVDEPSEEFLNAPDIERPAPAKKDNAAYVAESLQDIDEVMFAYRLLINDLMVIRDRIEWIWTKYRNSHINLVAAAIATNTACDLARNMMEDITPALKAHGGAIRVGKEFYGNQCMMKGFSMDDITNSGNEFNYDTYEIANDTYMIAYFVLEGMLHNLGPPNTLPVFDYCLPAAYDPTPNWDTMTMQKKYEQDKILMMEFCTDLMTVVRLVPKYPVRDEFIRGMQELDRTQDVPMYLVFAAQIFLDIHHVLRGKVYSAQELCMSHMGLMDEDLAMELDFHAKLHFKKSTTPMDEMLKGIRKLIKWIQDDPIYRINAQAFAKQHIPFIAPIHRILRYSPVISGLMLYHFRAQMYQLSLEIADSWGSVLYPMHLYRALRQENILAPWQDPTESWGDMDAAEGILSRDSFYVGSKLPQGRGDYLKTLGLQIGIAATAFTKSKSGRTRVRDKVRSKSGRRAIKRDCTPVSDMFIDRYVRNTGQVDWTPEHVDRVISRSIYDVAHAPQGGYFTAEMIKDPDRLRERKRNIAAEAAGKRAPTPADGRTAPDELIASLYHALAAESMPMVFPYLALHRTAWGILHAVRDSCDPVVLKMYGCSAHSEDEGHLPHVLIAILMALDSGDDRLSAKAGEAVKDQLRRGEGTRAVKRLEAMGYAVVLRFFEPGAALPDTPLSSSLPPGTPQPAILQSGTLPPWAYAGESTIGTSDAKSHPCGTEVLPG